MNCYNELSGQFAIGTNGTQLHGQFPKVESHGRIYFASTSKSSDCGVLTVSGAAILLWLCRDMLYPDDPSVCFLSFPFIRKNMTDTKVRGEKETSESDWLELSDWQRGLAALLVDILLQGADWQLEDVNDITCSFESQVQN